MSATALDQLEQLLGSVDIQVYGQTIPELPHGGIGAHVRHVLEFFECFFKGIVEGRLDYSARDRDLELECRPEKARAFCTHLRESLGNIPKDPQKALLVRSEAQSAGPWLSSSLGRELDYLEQHLIHHMALIAVIARRLGHDLPSDFGVAKSTLDFWESQSQCAP
jgi:uncharacterized damage-inducible protein DinB